MHKSFRKTGKLLTVSFLLGGSVFGALFALFTPSAATQTVPTSLGSYADWHASKDESEDGDVCFMVSQPKKREDEVQRRPARTGVFIIYNYDTLEIDGRVEVVSDVIVQKGYELEWTLPVRVTVLDDSFELIHNGVVARTLYERRPLKEEEIVERSLLDVKEAADAMIDAMMIQESIVVTARSVDGIATRDTYSLLGFARAYEAMRKACSE